MDGHEEESGDDEDHCIPVSSEEICQGSDGQGAGITLPPHQRCASNIVQLIATTDAREALQKSPAYKKVHESADEKLKTWWSRQGRSDLIASTIQSGLGVKFEVPGETRWNSEFDAKKTGKELSRGSLAGTQAPPPPPLRSLCRARTSTGEGGGGGAGQLTARNESPGFELATLSTKSKRSLNLFVAYSVHMA